MSKKGPKGVVGKGKVDLQARGLCCKGGFVSLTGPWEGSQCIPGSIHFIHSYEKDELRILFKNIYIFDLAGSSWVFSSYGEWASL